jgi:hypothetical protein
LLTSATTAGRIWSSPTAFSVEQNAPALPPDSTWAMAPRREGQKKTRDSTPGQSIENPPKIRQIIRFSTSKVKGKNPKIFRLTCRKKRLYFSEVRNFRLPGRKENRRKSVTNPEELLVMLQRAKTFMETSVVDRRRKKGLSLVQASNMGYKSLAECISELEWVFQTNAARLRDSVDRKARSLAK